ncbi:MAG: transporter substrate-binding domain-containing protein [Pseudomonadota bacterium]
MKIAALIAMCAAAGLGVGAAQAQERTLTIGTEGAYPPFNVVDNTGEVTGFDIDFGNALCEQLNATCEWVTMDFAGLIPALQNGRFDMVIASHSITADRLEVVDMVKYYSNSASFVMLTDSVTEDTSPDGLAGKTLGAQSGTTHASFLETTYTEAEFRLYPTQVEAYADLVAGRVDGVMGDTTALYAWANSEEGQQCCVLAGEPIVNEALGDGVGIIVTKGNEDLSAELTTAIDALRADGTYDRINADYFPFSIW